jgi:hypothetical protein
MNTRAHQGTVSLTMSYDYFLVHRAIQIQRLRARESGNRIEIPGRLARDDYSPAAARLLRTIDHICKLPLVQQQPGRMRSWMKALARRAPERLLTAKQRALIEGIERQLVVVRLSADPHDAQLAAGIMDALLRDSAFFDGLKPLPQHTKSFAHELLYPTWFNLYTAMRSKRPDGSPPPFSDEQAGRVFEFVGQYEARFPHATPALLALMTFAAIRFETDQAANYLQRLIDLCRGEEVDSDATRIKGLRALADQTNTGLEFERVLKDFLLVESARRPVSRSRRSVSQSGRPAIPPAAAERIRQLESDPQHFQAYRTLLRDLGRVIEGARGFDPEFSSLFETGEYPFQELLDLCLPEDDRCGALPQRGQRLVSQVIETEKQQGARSLSVIRAFAHHVASRLDSLDDDSLAVFIAEFVDKDRNRKVLLAASGSLHSRQQIADQLMQVVLAATDPDRFFSFLLLAATVGTAHDQDSLARIARSIRVLNLARADESISRRELADLMEDLRSNLPQALVYLDSPAFAGRGKSERLAKLYLTLNEACHLYAATGQAGNFGLTRAAYHNLDRLVDDI